MNKRKRKFLDIYDKEKAFNLTFKLRRIQNFITRLIIYFYLEKWSNCFIKWL